MITGPYRAKNSASTVRGILVKLKKIKSHSVWESIVKRRLATKCRLSVFAYSQLVNQCVKLKTYKEMGLPTKSPDLKTKTWLHYTKDASNAAIYVCQRSPHIHRVSAACRILAGLLQ